MTARLFRYSLIQTMSLQQNRTKTQYIHSMVETPENLSAPKLTLSVKTINMIPFMKMTLLIHNNIFYIVNAAMSYAKCSTTRKFYCACDL
jgi:hypothetical protein